MTVEKIRSGCIVAVLAVLGVLSAERAWTFEATTELHMKIMGLRDQLPPHYFEGSVFFSQKPKTQVRFIGIAFAHEDFREVHLFQRNQKGVLFFVYPLEEGRKVLDYRLIIDGLWTTDSTNPLKYREPTGITVSRYVVPEEAAEPKLNSPRIDPKAGTAEFNFKASPGKTVYVVGTFNSWDPYMHRLEEARPGFYSLKIKVLPGTHYYYFFADGRRKPDPLNREVGVDVEGNPVSVLHYNVQRSP